MLRIFLSSLFMSCLAFSASAQTIDENIEKGVRFYNEMRNFEESLQPRSVTAADIDKLKDFAAKGAPLLAGALTSGTAQQQKVARYFTANLQYEIGFTMGMKGQNYDAYDVLKKIENDYTFFADSTQFPLKYRYDNKNYAVTYPDFAPTLAEYYTGMGEISTNIRKYGEAVKFMQMSLAFPYTTPWYKYIAASKLWETSRNQGQRGTSYIDLTLSGLKYCSRLDTAYQRLIKENYYTTCQQFADTLAQLLLHTEYDYRANMLAKAAMYLDSAGDQGKASIFYVNAITNGLTNRQLLQQAAAFAYRIKSVDLQQTVERTIKNVKANEPDEVIRNLGDVLSKVVASANDPSKHFSETRGRRTHSRRYSGDIYRTSIELPGTTETFVNDFLKNSQANYYYWQSYIDEEPKAGLQGRLRKRYNAISDELRALYPNAKTSFKYNDINYLQLVLNATTTIELSYYYREGYKDVILLTVIAAYPK